MESRNETYASREEWFRKVAEHPAITTAKDKRAQHIEKFKEDERKVQVGEQTGRTVARRCARSQRIEDGCMLIALNGKGK